MDKVLELSFRSIIRILEGDRAKANEYKDKALEIHKVREFESKCNYRVASMIPRETRERLYKIVG